MKRQTGKYSKKAGLPPGTAVYTGERNFENVQASVTLYDARKFSEETFSDFSRIPRLNGGRTAWITVNGVHQPDKIERIAEYFKIHNLAVEDICNTSQRPKAVDYDDHYFIVVHDFEYGAGGLVSEQVSMVMKKKVLILFQDNEVDRFRHLKERISHKNNKARQHGVDFLVYLILDAIVDRYFLVLEQISDRIEILENELISDPVKETLHSIYHSQKDLAVLSKSLWPLRKLLADITGDSTFFRDEAVIHYFKDLHDHVMQIIEIIEGIGDVIVGMFEIYASSTSIKMNSIMKILTTIATIFMPLTFIAGIYGMNFRYMPGLEWEHGYFAILGLMAGIALTMIFVFKKKKWM